MEIAQGAILNIQPLKNNKMKKLFLTLVSVVLTATAVMAQSTPNLPKSLHSGPWKAGHVQGIAVDAKQEFVYLSFTYLHS